MSESKSDQLTLMLLAVLVCFLNYAKNYASIYSLCKLEIRYRKILAKP